MAQVPFDKIKDAALRRLAEVPVGENVSILVSINLPSRQMTVKRRGAADVSVMVPDSIADEGSSTDAAKRVKTVGDFLEHLTGKTPVWLEAARCFVLDIAPGHLESVAAHPEVKAIWANRTFEAFAVQQ